MLTQETVMQIDILHRQGYGIKAISRQLGISKNTVRTYLRNDIKLVRKVTRKIGETKLDKYRDYIIKMVDQAYPARIPATVLLEDIRLQGYEGGVSTLRNYIRLLLLRKKPPEAIIRYETPPGKQMQVDWAEFRKGKDTLHAFVATLGYSRMSYVEFVSDMKIETLLGCIERSFEYFGGVPKAVLFDNMKTVVTERDAYGHGEHKFQKRLLDFARHHGFLVKLCAPYRPQTKGKVERFISYLRHSFYLPLKVNLSFSDLIVDVDTANIKVKEWINSTANSRIHATTNVTPFSRWDEEKRNLATYMQYFYLPKMPQRKAVENKIGHAPKVIIQHDLSIYQQLLTHNYKENNYHEHTTRTYN